MPTVIHATHEALRKVGGIGAVLQGLLTSKRYHEAIERTILFGPMMSPSDEEQLAKTGEVLYSSVSGIDACGLTPLFKEVEFLFNVNLLYGKRRFADKATGVNASPEILLVDAEFANQRMAGNLKYGLYRKYGIQSDRYESIDDYELYVKTASPGFAALRSLLRDAAGPHVIVSHEYMGMPLALTAELSGDPAFRTVFYAHEVATVRPIVEDSAGHDTMFYNVLDRAISEGRYLKDVFGDQGGFYKHALVKNAVHCDNIFAVGDAIVREFRFLGPEFGDANIDLVYNGIPAFKISAEEKLKSKGRLQQYAENLLLFRPDYVFTHVTRLVVSKGLWRDLRVLEHLDSLFCEEGKTGVLFILSTLIGTGRSSAEVMKMEEDYGWPVVHKEGYPDLVDAEIDLYEKGVEAFNSQSRAIKVVFINQFGWSRDRCGTRMPSDMEFMDIRKGSDVEFGQSPYEPFGIAQVEPLSFGAICILSNVCGCVGFVEKCTGGKEVPNVIVANYTKLSEAPRSLDALLSIGFAERDAIEARNSGEVASKLFARLPRSREDVARLIEMGHSIAHKMSWEVVASDYFLPGIQRAIGAHS